MEEFGGKDHASNGVSAPAELLFDKVFEGVGCDGVGHSGGLEN